MGKNCDVYRSLVKDRVCDAREWAKGMKSGKFRFRKRWENLPLSCNL